MGAMTACSVEEVVDQAETNYIGFDAFANKVSRGLTADQFGHQNFAVWGKYDNVEVFKGKEVSWQAGTPSGSWTYSPLVPWVNGKTYEFAAIAPAQPSGVTYSYNYSSNLTGSEALNGTYSINNVTINQTTQTDYLTATPVRVVCNTASTSDVSFTFNHILSKIDFNFKPKTTSQEGETSTSWQSPVKIDIKKITLADVHTKNTYTNNDWTGSSEVGTFEKEGSSGAAIGSTTYDGNSTVTALENQFSWLVVPQDDTNASDRKLTIKFDLYTKDADGNYNVKNLENKEASVAVTEEWSANTHYTYTVYIGTDVLGTDPYITFDVANVEGWGTGTTSGLDVSTSTQQGN